MKTGGIITAIGAGIFYASGLFAQEFNTYVPESIPQNLQLNDEIQSFQVITTQFNCDLYGNFLNRLQVKGEYTRGLPHNHVKWENVTVANSMQPAGEFPEGEKLSFMEGYKYVPSAEMMNEENFVTFTNHSAFAKNLVWDMMGIEGLAWACLKQLELNKPFSAAGFNSRIDLAGQGFFENKNMMLTWTGISRRNNEVCAVIEYRTYNNPLQFAGEGLEMKGVSHYWGNIWVSMEDMQIEHATMFESVNAEMKLPGQQNLQVMSITREIEVLKKQ